jgi:hypothetical protein
MQAGLACPDWPLCYGSFLPGRQMNLQVFLEWFHRLDAFVVGIGVLVLATTTLLKRKLLPRWLPWLSGACLFLVAFQGALGALTVTLLLPPGIVTAHLATALLLLVSANGWPCGELALRLLCHAGKCDSLSLCGTLTRKCVMHSAAASSWWSSGRCT